MKTVSCYRVPLKVDVFLQQFSQLCGMLTQMWDEWSNVSYQAQKRLQILRGSLAL